MIVENKKRKIRKLNNLSGFLDIFRSSRQFNYTCLRIPLPSRLTGVPSSKTMWAVSFVTFSNLVGNLLRLTKLPVFRGVLTFPSAV